MDTLKIKKQIGTIEGTMIEVVEIETVGIRALDGWNGEVYLNCYECTEWCTPVSDSEDIVLKPTYKPCEHDAEQYEVIGFKQA